VDAWLYPVFLLPLLARTSSFSGFRHCRNHHFSFHGDSCLRVPFPVVNHLSNEKNVLLISPPDPSVF
jgi:hypothetical protein